MWALSAIALAINDAGSVDWSGGVLLQAEIRDDHNRPLPAGEIGEICIKGVPGKTIFKEYFLNPKATAKVLEADGWLHTGDTGYCDEEGFFISSIAAAI